jgi:hypothetical protein
LFTPVIPAVKIEAGGAGVRGHLGYIARTHLKNKTTSGPVIPAVQETKT